MSIELPETILLVGGSGFLGSNLGRALMDSGCHIIVVDKVPPRWDLEHYQDHGQYLCIAKSSIETIAGLLSKQRVDAVIHLASTILPGSSMEELCLDIAENLEPGLRLFDLLQAHGVQRYVYLSSGGTIYGPGDGLIAETDPPRPLNYYGWMKLAFEEFIRLRARLTPLQYLILRPSNPYGRYQNIRGRQGLVSVIFGRILDQLPLEVWGDGSNIRDYFYIDDFCQAVLSLLKLPNWNSTFNIGSGQGTSINEIIQLAREITGKPLRVDYLPSRSVDAPMTVLDISRLREHYDQPFLPLSLGMEHYWTEIQGNLDH